ncbi:MAG: MAPEG family protein [Paracoccaceae bacterium]
MTIELTILLAVMLLAASMWLPYIIGVNIHLPSTIDPFQKPYDHSVLPDWVQRANRAHLNLLEQAMPFAVLVLLAHQLSVTSTATVIACWTFAALRLTHAIGMTTGTLRLPGRPIVFTLAWVCILVLGVEIARLA